MSQIKCRVWDTKEKRMIEHNSQKMILLPCVDSYGAITCYHDERCNFLDEDFIDWASADLINGRYEIIQYIGCEDKNDVEIYEKDIVKFPVILNTFLWIDYFDSGEFAEEYENPTKFITSKIKFESGSFFFKHQYGYEGKEVDFSDVEVIGNVRENPKLL